MMNNYYVYKHLRLDKNTVFYVGKGRDKRAFIKSGRNDYWSKIVNKCGYKVEIFADNLTEEEAWQKEKDLIIQYKDNGFCEANITLGGEGVSGLLVSQETRDKLSKAMKGKYVGKVHSEQSRKNMSCGSIGQRTTRGMKQTDKAKENMSIGHGGRLFSVYSVICVKNPAPRIGRSGIYNIDKLIGTFINQREVSDKFNINQSDISLCLHGKIKQIKGYTFEYIKDNI